MTIPEGLTFDDILLVPSRSHVKSRKDISTRTKLTKKIELNIPVISANMDTVTEHETAIAMAREGGLGIIHRFLTVEQQVQEVLKVKRSESIVIENPYTVAPDLTVADAQMIMSDRFVHGLLVVSKTGRLEGILTARDILFETNPKAKVRSIMTPRARLVTAKPGTSLSKAREILHKNRIEKLPLVDSHGRLSGLITANDLEKIQRHPNATKDKKGRLLVGAAVGVKPGFIERANALHEVGVDALVVDIAHGHSDLAINTVKQLRKQFGESLPIIAGNVATAEGTRDLIAAGADTIKVGVGPGSICITRLVAGAGVPQFTAIQNCVKAAAHEKIPLIADGGIKRSGDITKALAVGASTVMVGNLLAGTDEAPGLPFTRNGMKYKVSRGMASFGASLGRKERENKKDEDTNDFVPEGVEAMVPYRGSVHEILTQLVGGLRSGISYGGATSILELQRNAKFVRITPAGLKESKPHDVEVV